MTTVALTTLRLLLAGCLCIYAAYAVASVWAALKWRASRVPPQPDWTPGVTILKPVRGVESPHALDSFRSFCRQDYPADRLQIVFGCLDSDDPAIPLIRTLQQQNPECRIDLVIAGPGGRIGSNLKVCNLVAMLPTARFDTLLLCDSDMRVEPDYVRRVVAPFQSSPDLTGRTDRGVGLVTCPYRGCLPQSFPAVLELLGIGAEFIPSTVVSRAVEGVGFAFGSTIAVKRSILEEIGGLHGILNDLADDYRMGARVRAAGYEVVLSDYCVDDVLGKERFAAMWNRRLRWARTVRSCRPAGYAGMFVTFGTVLGMAFCAAYGFSRAGVIALCAAVCLRLLASAVIAAACTRDRGVLRFLPLIPISDLLSFALYLASYCGNKIVWRGDTYRLLKGGKLERVS